MAQLKIRGNTQIMMGTITNAEISATAAIATSKLADGAEFVKRDGSVALTGSLNAGGFRITNAAEGVNASDLVTKSQLESVAAGLVVKGACHVATTEDINIATQLNPGDVIDGHTLADGDRVLVKNQADPKQNGVYVAGATPVRAADFDGTPVGEVSGGDLVYIDQGTSQAKTAWVLQGVGDLVVGTDNLIWNQFSGAGSQTASNLGSGAGVFKELVGSDLRFRSLVDSSEIDVTENANDISFALVAGSVTGAKIASETITGSNLVNDTITSTQIAAGAVGESELASSAVVDSKVSASAAIARSKLASGTADHVVINDGTGVLSSEAHLSLARGGSNADLSAASAYSFVHLNSAGTAFTSTLLSASVALVTDANGLPTGSSVTATELGYLSGLTSSLQTQLDARLSESKFIFNETPSGTVDGTNTVFTLANTPITGKLQVTLNGLVLRPGSGADYTVSGSTITFESGAQPEVGDVLAATYIFD